MQGGGIAQSPEIPGNADFRGCWRMLWSDQQIVSQKQ
jgi:hypothetical protein